MYGNRNVLRRFGSIDLEGIMKATRKVLATLGRKQPRGIEAMIKTIEKSTQRAASHNTEES